MGVATLGLTMAHIFTKIILEGSRIKPFEIVYWQGIVTTLTMIFLMKYYEKKQRKEVYYPEKFDIYQIPKDVRKVWLLRGLFGFLGNIFGTISMKLIPLAQATVLFYTNPIFIGLFGYIFMKEKVTNYDIGGICCTFIGVVIFTLDPFGFSKVQNIQNIEIGWW